MPLELQLQTTGTIRTTGTVYGEIMRDSGVTLPNGRYVSGKDFVFGLVKNGVVPRQKLPTILKDFDYSIGYGSRDNIWTGIQYLKEVTVDGRSDGSSTYIFNPLKELMKGSFLGTFHEDFFSVSEINEAFETLKRNPREGVERIRGMYALFDNLPQPLKEKFWSEINRDPCSLALLLAVVGVQYAPSHLLKLVNAMLEHIPRTRREDLRYVLGLITEHNICVRKGELIRSQIEHLVVYNTSEIPIRWRKGNLDDAIVRDRADELKKLLKGKHTSISQ